MTELRPARRGDVTRYGGKLTAHARGRGPANRRSGPLTEPVPASWQVQHQHPARQVVYDHAAGVPQLPAFLGRRGLARARS